MVCGICASADINNCIDLALDGVVIDVSEICWESDGDGVAIGQRRVVAESEGVNGVCCTGLQRIRIDCEGCKSVGLDCYSVALRLLKHIAGRRQSRNGEASRWRTTWIGDSSQRDNESLTSCRTSSEERRKYQLIESNTAGGSLNKCGKVDSCDSNSGTQRSTVGRSDDVLILSRKLYLNHICSDEIDH